jgi:diaminohydroxyphosphoribosylaminopyrimidine deaminase/5-amino-6-(5-phosphoribosylamino)uracil reductase
MSDSLANDAAWMDRAIHLAMGGRGAVEPNPMVGCVLVKDGRVIGEGRHERFGSAHAEPNALASCTESPAGAIAYVTLEPCCHTDKKTPPCTPLLIAARISRVVIGCLDPNPKVAGNGVEQLRASGIETHVGIRKEFAEQLIAPYLARVLHQRPYLTLKWAESADGKVAGEMGRRVKIANSTSMSVVHDLRARCDAILVGIRTVLNDDPLLTARPTTPPPLQRQLLRLVLDPNLRFPPECKLAKSGEQGPVTIFCSERTYQTRPHAVTALTARHIAVVPLRSAGARLAIDQLLSWLKPDVTHLLVEPGPGLARAFLQDNYADRVWRFRSPNRIESDTAPVAENVPYPEVAEVSLDGDSLCEYLNPSSNVYFADAPSADMQRVMNAKSPRRQEDTEK